MVSNVVVDVNVRGPMSHGSHVAHVVKRQVSASESEVAAKPRQSEAAERVAGARVAAPNVAVGVDVVAVTRPRSEGSMPITPSSPRQQSAAVGDVVAADVGPVA